MQIFDSLVDLEIAQYQHPHNPSPCASASLLCIFGPEHPSFSELVKLQDDPESVLNLASQTTRKLNFSTTIPTSSSDFLNQMENPHTIGSMIIFEESNGIGHIVGTRKVDSRLQIHLIADTESDRTMQIAGPHELLDFYLNAKVNTQPPFISREVFIFTRTDSDIEDSY